MALNASPSANRPASPATSAAGALSTNRASTSARPDADDDSGFAAQLQRAAAPDPSDVHRAPVEARSGDKSEGAGRSGKGDKSDRKSDKSDESDEPDAPAKAADEPAASAPADANALQWIQQQMAAAGASLKPTLSGDLAKGTEALRKGGLGAKDVKDVKDGKGLDAASAALATAAAGTGLEKADAGKDLGDAAADALAGLGQGLGAGNSASDTRDSLAALLPGADGMMPAQANAAGANPNGLDFGRPMASSSAPAQATLDMTPQSPAFGPALGQQIEVWMRDGVQHAEVQLTPQDLGPIRVQIAVDGTDTRVALHADVASTREALQDALPLLSQALGQAGLSLTGGGVSDQSSSQSQGQFGFGPGREGRGGAGTAAGDAQGAAGILAGDARPPSTPRGLVDAYA